MKQDRLQRARERFADCMEVMQSQHSRMREDLRFSNPANPEQWSKEAMALRGARPALIFDNTNKFIRQVVNDGRASVPSIQTVPADGFAHAKAAEALNGRIRHIEYASRARVAYDTSLDLAARCGLGWIRVVPEILNAESNQQEPRILRIKSPFECVLDASWQEPDGSDAEYGFVLSPVLRKKFKDMHPKSVAAHGWEDDGKLWTKHDTILIAEYFELVRTKVNKILVLTPDGEHLALTEDEYWQLSAETGEQPEVISTFVAEDRRCTWTKMTGCDELESTDFPSKYIPIVPVIGTELWIDGERHLSGLTRELMDGQRMHNAEMSSYIESTLSQPKAPFTVPMEAIEGHEEAWKKMNTGNPAFLPFNAYTEDGKPIPSPNRQSPPTVPTAFAQGVVMGSNAMMNSVGVYRSGLGQESANAVSGVAKQQDRRESNTSTYHYNANLAISLQQVGRILIDMDRRLTDTPRSVRTMAEDGKPGQIRYDPTLQQAVQMKGNEVTAINPNVGEYDLRVKVGPSYLTQNEETASELSEMFRGAPELLPALGPLWVTLKGIPNGETVKKLLIAMAPPNVQSVYAEEEEDKQPLPPQVRAEMQKKDQQIQQLSQALEAAAAEADKTKVEKEKARIEREKSEGEMLTRGYHEVTERLKVLLPGLTPEQLFALAQLTFGQGLRVPPTDPSPAMPPMQMPHGMPQEMQDMPPGMGPQSAMVAGEEDAPISFDEGMQP